MGIGTQPRSCCNRKASPPTRPGEVVYGSRRGMQNVSKLRPAPFPLLASTAVPDACKLLGYAKVVGTLVRAMRVVAVAIRAVPRAARVLRLAAVFIRSYEGRRRSKDLHEASIVIQRRAGRHMALKVRGRDELGFLLL